MILVEFSRKTHGKPDAMRDAVNSLAGQIAIALAREIHARVETGGAWSAKFPKYSARRHAYDISPRYPVQPSGGRSSERRDGVTVWASSADYHAAARRPPGNVSGGMWDGLSAVLTSATFARVMFRGRSEGQRPSPKRTKGGKPRGRMVNNALKAASVLQQTGFNVIDLTADERERVNDSVLAWIAKGLDEELIADVIWSKSLDASFLTQQ